MAPTPNGTLLCTSLVGRTIEELAAKAGIALSAGSDLVEFRFDSVERLVPRSIRVLAPFLDRSVFTVRSPEEGGAFQGPESERLTLIRALAESNPGFIDVELNTLKRHPELSSAFEGSKTIISWHDTEKTPSEEQLRATLEEAESYGGVPKLVATATDPIDNLRILSLYERRNSPPSAVCMGPMGLLSRIVAMERGSPLAYASLMGEGAAPGQPSLALMLAMRRRGNHA